MTIKHLVISGGGPSGLLTLGAAKFLAENNIWNIDNIETIYGTSIGAYMGVIFALKYDWDEIINYFIERPWEKLLDFSPTDLLNIWQSKGLLDKNFIRETLKPLFGAKNLSINLTLHDFFEYTQIDIHMFSVDFNSNPLKKYDISHDSHPDLLLIDALSMTMALTPLFKPVIQDNKCFIDGGVVVNFPLQVCIDATKCDENEILAFKNNWSFDDTKIVPIGENTSFIEFIIYMIKVLVKQVDNDTMQPEIPNIVQCMINDTDGIQDWMNILSVKENRKKWIEKGETAGFLYKKYMENS